MEIVEKSKYPELMGFPHTLQVLKVVGIDRKFVDSRTWKLKALSILDLSENLISKLPDELTSKLPNLQELHFAGNQTEHVPLTFFTGKFAKNLKLLDLSRNGLKFLPNQLANLEGLVTLKLDQNLLERLPVGIGKLQKLRHLSVSGNNLATLPFALKKSILLDTFDVSQNPFMNCENKGHKILDTLCFPPLLDLATIFCLKNKIRMDPEDLPGTVRRHIESYLRCRCGQICLTSKAVILVPSPLSFVATQVTADTGDILFETVVCSKSCLEKYKNNPFAL